MDKEIRADTPRVARVQAAGVSKSYGHGKQSTVALDDVSLTIEPGQMVVLLGPSGCGKTTLLRSIAGLERPHRGEINVDNKQVFSADKRIWVPPEKRALAMVFQSYALWPNMSVFENVAYPLRCRRVPREQVKKQVTALLEKVGLAHLATRAPAQLSGGQQQRVAVARALASKAKLVLFDEPLSNVDAKVREQIRNELLLVQRELGFAGLYVTHDQGEAGALADLLAVMDHGRIVHVDTPERVYRRPASRYVANFVGSANEVVGSVAVTSAPGETAVDSPLGRLAGRSPEAPLAKGAGAVAIFRPESCRITSQPPDGTVNAWAGEIERRVFMGAQLEYMIACTGADGNRYRLIAQADYRAQRAEGDSVYINIDPQDVSVFAS